MERAQDPLIPTPEFTFNNDAEIALDVNPADPNSYADIILFALEDSSLRVHDEYYNRQAAAAQQQSDAAQEVAQPTTQPEGETSTKDEKTVEQEIRDMRLLILDLRGGSPTQLSGKPLRQVITWLEDAKEKTDTPPELKDRITKLLGGFEFQVTQARTLLNWWENRGDTNFED